MPALLCKYNSMSSESLLISHLISIINIRLYLVSMQIIEEKCVVINNLEVKTKSMTKPRNHQSLCKLYVISIDRSHIRKELFTQWFSALRMNFEKSGNETFLLPWTGELWSDDFKLIIQKFFNRSFWYWFSGKEKVS